LTILRLFTARHRAVRIARLPGIAVVAGLAACTGQPKPVPNAPASTEQVAEKAVVNASIDALADETLPEPHGGVVADVTAAPEGETNIVLRTPERAPIPDVTPRELMGMDPAMLEDLLGQPELRRNEPPAAVWQYRAETCVFDLVLYSEPDNDNLSRVTFFEARDRDAQPANAADCLDTLLRQRAS